MRKSSLLIFGTAIALITIPTVFAADQETNPANGDIRSDLHKDRKHANRVKAG